MQLIDIGANLTQESFHSDLPQVIQAAQDVGVTQMMVTGASHQGSHDALALAKQYPGILYATAGIHPHHATETTTEVMADLKHLASHPEVKALGETGLDYFRDFSPRDVQQASFRAHLELAAELKKPLFLHERDAADDFAAILKEYRSQLSQVVVHCFTGNQTALEAYLELDCHIGITGWICDERRGQHLIELVKLIPDDRLMIETDAPYLLPRNLKPKPKSRRNEPKYLPHICEFIAESRNQSPAHVAEISRANSQEFFAL